MRWHGMIPGQPANPNQKAGQTDRKAELGRDLKLLKYR